MPSASCWESDWYFYFLSYFNNIFQVRTQTLPLSFLPPHLTTTHRIIWPALWHPTIPKLSSIAVLTGFYGSCFLYVWFIPPFPHQMVSSSRQACILLTSGLQCFALLFFVSMLRPAMVAGKGHSSFIGCIIFFLELLLMTFNPYRALCVDFSSSVEKLGMMIST